MDIFLKVTVGILITALMSVVLSKQGADISLLLTLLVCCTVLIAAATYLKPILDLTNRLIQIGNLDNELLNILLKVTGIGLLSQIAGFICTDAGNYSLAKALQIMTTATLLSISVPLLEEILSVLESILREV